MARSGGEKNFVTMLWRIENISCFEKGFHIDRVRSPFLKSEILGGNFLSLNMNQEIEQHLNLRILNTPLTKHALYGDCEFSFLSADGTPLVSKTERGWGHNSIQMHNCPTIEEVFVTKKSSFLYHDTLTVRCRIWKPYGNFELSEFISACSRIQVSEDSFLWSVAGFDEFKEVRSLTPVVLNGFSSGSQVLNCRCTLVGDCIPDSALDIRVTTENTLETFSLKFEVSALDGRQNKTRILKTWHIFLASRIKETWTVSNDELNEALQDILDDLSFEDNLNLLFHFKAVAIAPSNFIDTTCGQTNVISGEARTVLTFSDMGCQTSEQNNDTTENLSPEFKSLSNLGEDLGILYLDQTMSDYKLRSGDVSFPVHKNILSARSPVFKTMFSIEMKESSSDSLDVPDVDSHTLNRMLTFLYTSGIEPDLAVESAAKLYYAADKYQVDSLKSRCSSILRSGTSVSNVSDVLSLAHKHEDQELTSFAHEFILNRFEEVMHSTKWESFLDSDPSLAGKTAHQLYKEKKARKKLRITTK